MAKRTKKTTQVAQAAPRPYSPERFWVNFRPWAGPYLEHELCIRLRREAEQRAAA